MFTLEKIVDVRVVSDPQQGRFILGNLGRVREFAYGPVEGRANALGRILRQSVIYSTAFLDTFDKPRLAKQEEVL